SSGSAVSPSASLKRRHMLLVGVTGGIGAGKSTFAALLVERGAQVIDADQMGRAALDPGKPAWRAVVETFGDEVLAAASMNIDRKRLAQIVFNDPDKLAALNAIVHPVILHAIADELDILRNTNEIVILDAALLFELGLNDSVDVVIVVVADPKTREKRLVERGMSLQDVHARMEAQVDPSSVTERAQIVVRNDGTLEDLAAEADRVYGHLEALR
ncbi:MAG: dephospho-CoA kinase, partial [Actinomycetota bacterium]|nr:dephospho-CoA kinase [Actinomycetota bacterium]